MNELVNMIVTKTGIPQATAQTVVNMVVDFIKKKLPAPVGAQIDGLLSNAGAAKQAEDVFSNMTSKFGKK